MQLIFTEPAARDLDDIIDYIALDNPAAAEKVFRTIITSSQRLSEFPGWGHAGRLSATREFAVTGRPYLIVYQVVGDTLTILAMFHGARDLARALADRRNEPAKPRP
ncbi:MAG: type II toxin-antitoxin system RelE/ParE family toxin [Rhodanobacter sp.]|nr:MAG: type II toxin-antitoxin system RelE/ParE family toxin [Rhodanobacter sp.]TAM07052.1 MAG: type II toxin-antitoxin system RelE/ParE family toxin [Rhodanobacter sp.]TAM39404.1 MAG: type II toxin-antitoxin system RelE/ParE family toxin [Rhodanobacter sp.]TAN26967.1 MAG: type II toxin-antitoxin system RelE/ParE family toxin [Rhodanobacter sp.]